MTDVKQGVALVLDVVSGDQLLLGVGKVTTGPNRGDVIQKRVSVAGVTAPRLARSGERDEPGAWESKEWLRKELIGKKVQWRELYASQSGETAFVEVRVEGGDRAHIGVTILSNGMGRLTQGGSAKQNTPNYGDLEAAEQAAMSNGLGVHAGGMVREVVNFNQGDDFDVNQWFESNKLKNLRGVIENIKDANSYRVCLVPGSDAGPFVVLNIHLSGIQNPVIRRIAGGKEAEETPGSGAFFARSFAMERLLGRELNVRLESLTRGGQNTFFVASVIHDVKGSVAEFFLDMGFATYVDWSAQNSFSGPEKLKDRQQKAQERKVGRWKDGAVQSLDHFEFNGKVVEVVSGDQLKIIDVDLPIGKRVEVRYYLSSLKAPALREEQAGTQAGKWRQQSIEYIRKKMIGKVFKVRLDYKKNFSQIKDASGAAIQGPAPSDEKTKDCYFVTVSDQNLKDKPVGNPATNEKGGMEPILNLSGNAMLDAVRDGMVAAAPTFGGSEDAMSQRSRDFDLIVQCENAAKAEGKGIHSAKSPPSIWFDQLTELVLPQGGGSAIRDLEEGPKKKQTGGMVMGMKGRRPTTKKELSECAKAYEQQLTVKKNGHECLISYVMTGTRMRVKLLHEKIHLTFAVNGVKCPNAPRQNVGDGPMTAEQRKMDQLYAPQPFGAESLQYAREYLMQQEARIVIDRVDPAGTFTGQLFVKRPGQTQAKEDFAMSMLKKGLAYCDDWCETNVYWTAQEEAKKAKMNYWSLDHAGPLLQETAKGSSDTAANLTAGTPLNGEIVHINSLDDFYLCQGGEDQKIATQILSELSAAENVETLQKRQIYLAQNWDDKKWYRAKFVGRGGNGGRYSMYFIDSGAYSDVDLVRKIKPGSTLLTQPAAVVRCGLFAVKTSNDVWEDACAALFKKSKGSTVKGTIEKVINDKNPEPGQQTEIRKVVLFTTQALQAAEKAGGSASRGNAIVTPVSLNEFLIKECFCRLTNKERNFSQLSRVDYDTWRNAETTAKKTRSKLWKHGSPDSDDDDDF